MDLRTCGNTLSLTPENIRKPSCISAWKVLTSWLNSFLRYCKDTYFEYFSVAKLTSSKKTVSIYRKLGCSLHKKSTSSLFSFLRYCKYFANLLFRVTWAGLAMLIKIDAGIHVQDTLMFICMQNSSRLMLVSVCTIFWYLSACKKSTSSLPSFLRYQWTIQSFLGETATHITHQTHEGATMVGFERINFQNLCLQRFKIPSLTVSSFALTSSSHCLSLLFVFLYSNPLMPRVWAPEFGAKTAYRSPTRSEYVIGYYKDIRNLLGYFGRTWLWPAKTIL